MSYRSRFRDPDPSRGPDPRYFPTERDLLMLKRIDARRFVASNWLHRFIGGDYARYDKRLAQLFDGGYVARINQHIHPDSARSRHLVYALTDKGRRTLVEHGITPVYASTRQYLHEFLASFIYDSIEIGAREAGYEFLGWDILQHDTRVQARHSQQPFKVKLSSGFLALDGSPMVMKKGEHVIRIPGVEVDRNTEPLRSFDLREKWSDKIRAHAEFVSGRHYATHYGLKSCIIPIFTTNRQHMLNLMELYKDTLKAEPTWPLFQTVEDWPKARFFPKPNGALFSEPYHTLSGKPYHLAPDRFGPVLPPFIAAGARVPLVERTPEDAKRKHPAYAEK